METWIYLDTSSGASNHHSFWVMRNNEDLNGAISLNVGDYFPDTNYVNVATYNGIWNDHFSNSQVPVTVWTHIAVVYDGISTIYFYMNEILDGSAVFTEPSSPIVNLNHAISSVAMFDGNIDEFRLLDTDKSEGWINTSFNNQSDPGTFYTIGSEKTK